MAFGTADLDKDRSQPGQPHSTLLFVNMSPGVRDEMQASALRSRIEGLETAAFKPSWASDIPASSPSASVYEAAQAVCPERLCL